MSQDKSLSLEEARKKKKLDRFSKEHPSTGDKMQFDALLESMAHNKKLNNSKGDAKT